MNDICPNNRQIRCEQQNGCDRCGWNPKVVEKRKAQILGTVEVYDETRQKVIGRVKWPVLGCMSDQYG